MSKNIESHVLREYTVVQEMGSGAYGHVWEVKDKKTGQKFALKKIFDAFRNSIDAQRTYREVEVLYYLQHPNIIKMQKVMKSKNKKDLYVVFQFMEADLHSVVGTEILEKVHQIFVFYQILTGLHYLHSAELIHRDLKPSNVLLNSECKAKLCDFGLIRSLRAQKQQQAVLSQEVATKWYRAPELLLGSRSYGKPIDLWSFGCIVAELLLGKPIFAGNSTLNQLEKIIEFSGEVSPEDIEQLDSPVAQQLFSQIKIKKKSQRELLNGIDPDFHQLILGCFKINPHKRMTIEQALKLDIFKEYAEETKILPTCPIPIIPNLDDNYRLGVKIYRDKIYDDIDERYRTPSSQRKLRDMTSTLNRDYKKKSVSQGKTTSKKKYAYFNHKTLGSNNSLNNTKSSSVHSVGNIHHKSPSPKKNPYIKQAKKRLYSPDKGEHHSNSAKVLSYQMLKNKFMKAKPVSNYEEPNQSKLIKKTKPKVSYFDKKNMLKGIGYEKPKSLHKYLK